MRTGEGPDQGGRRGLERQTSMEQRCAWGRDRGAGGGGRGLRRPGTSTKALNAGARECVCFLTLFIKHLRAYRAKTTNNNNSEGR